jgi:hypothetical protein
VYKKMQELENVDRLRIPTVRFHISKLSDSECGEYLRFTRVEILQISSPVRFPDIIYAKERTKVYIVEVIYITMERLKNVVKLAKLAEWHHEKLQMAAL